jgi:hypothetical protein
MRDRQGIEDQMKIKFMITQSPLANKFLPRQAGAKEILLKKF